jgi:hypothetical protein
MHVSLGDQIKQEIPIINTSDKEVTIKVSLEGDPSFTGYIMIIQTERAVPEKESIRFVPSDLQA